MARMLPASPAAGTASDAERRLFACLEAGLPDDVTVLHGVGWVARGDAGPEQGEADFVVLDPRGGALVIEVKGGGIAYEPERGWVSRGRGGTHAIKDPAGQASGSMHDLVARIRKARQRPLRTPRVGYAVAFPDVRVGQVGLPPSLPPELVIDGDALRAIGPCIDAIWDWWEARPGMGQHGVELCVELLRPRVELPAPRGLLLRAHVLDVIRLTREQYRLLDMLERVPRAAVAGCAGSGKTLLAMEKARRLAAAGDEVLVVCFNVLLCRYLAAELDVPGVTVRTFHGLCRDALAWAGVEPPELVEGEEAAHYAALEEAFGEAVLEVGPRFDAIVVDEGQDFHDGWWAPLQLLLRDEQRGCLYVFHDAGQQIFQRDGHPAAPPGVEIVLRENLRSARRVAAVIAQHATDELVPAGPEGGDVQEDSYRTDIQLQILLARILRAWVDEDGIAPSEIAVLTPRRPGRSALWGVEELGGVPLVDDPDDATGALRSSVHRFKGLERTAVVLCEVDPTTRREILYTGLSRARSLLAILRQEPAGG